CLLRERRDRLWQRHVVLENHKLARHPRLIGIRDQAFAPLRLLDLGRALQKRVEVAVGLDQLGRGLDADAGHARYVVDRIAGQRLNLDHLLRRNPEPLLDLGWSDAIPLIGSCIITGPPTSCIRSLSDDRIVTLAPSAAAAFA